MGQIRIRRTSADLPVFDEGVDLEPVSSLGADGSSVSGFEFGAASVRALDVKGVRLFDGKIRAVRAEHASVTPRTSDPSNSPAVNLGRCDGRDLRRGPARRARRLVT